MPNQLQEIDIEEWDARNEGKSKRKEQEQHTYLHSCHSMATGENKAGLTMGLALALLLLMLPLAFPSHLLFHIHHRLLLIKKTLLCDGLRPRDGEEGMKASRFALPAVGW